MDAKLITITITSSKYQVLGDYLQDYQSPAFPAAIKNKQNQGNKDFDFEDYAEKFCQYTNESNIYNYEQIENAYSKFPSKVQDITNLRYSGKYLELPIKPGIKFTIPLESIAKESLLTQGIEVVSNNEPAFKAQALIDLESDKGYKKVFTQGDGSINHGDLSYQYPDFTVWVWCRSLSDNNSPFSNELTGQIFNITPFVYSLQTSNTKNGGNFNLSLSPINAERDPETGQWMLKRGSYLGINEKEVVTHSYSHQDVRVDGKVTTVRNQFLLHNIIGTNDLFFIRYETLQTESEQRLKDNAAFYVDKKDLPNRIYDMIGLVDSNTLASQFESNEIGVSIRGRDLSKLFIDDGTYFYSAESKQGVFYLQGGASAKNQYTQRIISDNAYLYLGLYYNNSIEDILKFVIQQLSTIKVVPDALFSAYAGQPKNTDGSLKITNLNNTIPPDIQQTLDKRNTQFNQKVFADEQDQKTAASNLEKRKQDILTKEKNIVRKIKDFRHAQYIINNPFFNEIGFDKSAAVYKSLRAFVDFILNNVDANKNTIAKVQQSTLVGWRPYAASNSTNGSVSAVLEDTFPTDFISNDPNTDFSFFNEITDLGYRTVTDDTQGILQDIYNILKEKNELKKTNFVDYPQVAANGIWQLVKLVIDKKVAKRLLIDSSLSSATGSIMNFLKKACQEPFVEIFMDTYYDQFYVIVREPPTNKVGMLSYLTGNYQDNQNLNSNDDDLSSPAIIDINDIDIASESLGYTDNNIYSWYHFTPQSVFINGSEKYSTSFVPALNFPEYSDIWGSKSMDFVHNYTNYYAQYSKNGKESDLSQFQKQAFYDMKYIVESNAYRPFTREGSITITGGDRRIKIGNMIRLVSTGEIFMVDAVSNGMSIGQSVDRSTTIQVSRGMKEVFIYGVKGSVLNETFKGTGLKFTNEQVFSYFDIINTTLNFDKKKTVTKYKTIKEKVLRTSLTKTTDYDKIEGGYADVVLSDVSQDVRTEKFKDVIFVKSNDVLTSLDLENKLSVLNPDAQPKFRQFINKLYSLGWQVLITSGKRSLAEQAQLKRNLSLNASPETSKHVKGLAIDINVIATKNINGIKSGTQLRKGNNEQERLYWNKYWIQSGIPTVASAFGLTWGGLYTSYKDNVHFEISNAPEAPTQPDYVMVSKQVEDGTEETTDEEAVFSNFKVNQEVFNFFVRKQQEGYYSNTFNVFNNTDKMNMNDLIDNKIISEDQLNNLSGAEKENLKNGLINSSIKSLT
jgi:hypothetical protein